MLGGDHSLTQGAVRAAAKRFPDLRLVHIDAHTDLRDQYQGDRLSHASVLRRCHEILGDGRIHLLGVRSGLREEFSFARAHGRLHAFSLEGAAGVFEEVGAAPVYLSLDLDILDPSILPGTGSPEPGGVNYRELLAALTLLSPLRIVGSDIMELAPALDPSGASTAVACKLIREWLLLLDKGLERARPFPGMAGKRTPGLAPESKIRRAGMDTHS
jgi:agmatinase